MSAIRFVLTLSMLAIIGGATVTWGEEATETAKVAKLGPDVACSPKPKPG
jgi:hypothetical protein